MAIIQTTFHNIDFTHDISLPKNNEKIICYIQDTLNDLLLGDHYRVFMRK